MSQVPSFKRIIFIIFLVVAAFIWDHSISFIQYVIVFPFKYGTIKEIANKIIIIIKAMKEGTEVIQGLVTHVHVPKSNSIKWIYRWVENGRKSYLQISWNCSVGLSRRVAGINGWTDHRFQCKKIYKTMYRIYIVWAGMGMVRKKGRYFNEWKIIFN